MANPPAPDVEAIVGAVGGAVTPDTPLHRALLALRAPHAALARVPNTVRQSIADVLVDGANRAFLAERHTASLQARVEELERERDAIADAREKLLDTIAADVAEANRMREALRRRSLHEVHRMAHGGGTVWVDTGCKCCGLQWPRDQPEEHAPGCLAALRPADEPVTQREM